MKVVNQLMLTLNDFMQTDTADTIGLNYLFKKLV